jgi:hypothetical protein
MLKTIVYWDYNKLRRVYNIIYIIIYSQFCTILCYNELSMVYNIINVNVLKIVPLFVCFISQGPEYYSTN